MSSTARPSRVEILARERVYAGYCKVDRYTLRHERFAGGLGPVVTREVVERGHAAAVLLYDPEADHCVMIEQFRPGAHAAGRPAWMLEVVAGIIEDGESAEDVCRREALEEAGCTISTLEHCLTYLVTPGICTETIDLFVGRVDSRAAGGIHGLAEEGEDIRVLTMDLPALRTALDANLLDNATALMAVQWLLLNHEKLRARWRAA